MSNCEGCNWRLVENDNNDDDDENASKIKCVKLKIFKFGKF